MTASEFLRLLNQQHSLRTKPVTGGARGWTRYMTRLLHLTAFHRGLVCCCKQGSKGEHSEIFGDNSGCEEREYLFDLTWYSGEIGEHEQPSVLIEQENSYSPREFKLDFWKTMLGFAPLRVMIGYTKTKSERQSRVDWVNSSAEEYNWKYPDFSEDLLLLGYRAMKHGDFLVSLRSNGENRWSELGSLLQF